MIAALHLSYLARAIQSVYSRTIDINNRMEVLYQIEKIISKSSI